MRFSPRTIAGAAAAVCLLALGACDTVSNMFSPGQPAADAPARLALQATIPRFQGSSFTTVALRVASAYQRADQSFVSLATQTITLTNETTQQVPLSVELGACLADPLRVDADTDPTACFVRLDLTLLGDGRALDAFQVSGLRLVPGVTTAVPQAVQLFEVASVVVTAASTTAPLPPIGTTLRAGTTLALGATVSDASGQVLAGRTITWSSSNSAAASVSATGVVTGVAAGATTISAVSGGRTGSVELLITPPTQRLSVVGVASTGAGRVLSDPTGIDCAITAGVPSGTCAFDFPLGVTVDLSAIRESATTARFDGWTGACIANGTSPDCTLVMDQPRTTGSSFTGLALVTLSAAQPFGGVTVGSPTEGAQPGQTLNCAYSNSALNGSCTLTFLTGTTLTLTAFEIGIARAIGWTGCDTATRTTCTLLLSSSAPRSPSLDAHPGNVVVVQALGTGAGVVTAPNVGSVGLLAPLNCGPSVPQGLEVCSSGYPIGTTVEVTATPDAGSRLVGWGSSPCAVSGSTCTISSTSGDGSEIRLFPEFAPDLIPVTLQLAGSGGGTVFSNGTPVCILTPNETSRQCGVDVLAGSFITFTGAPSGGGQFLGFGGACSGTSCPITITNATTITASFTSVAPSVTINVAPIAGHNSSGFIFTGSFDIDCNIVGTGTTGPCATTRPQGSTVTISAVDDIFELTSGIGVFARWTANSPCPGSVALECTFVATNAVTTVEVEFVPGATIDIALGGSGTLPGSLTASVPGYRSLQGCSYVSDSLPTNCRFVVPAQRTATLTAFPSSGGNVDAGGVNFCSFFVNGCTFVVNASVTGSLYFFPPLLFQLSLTEEAPRTFADWQRAHWAPTANGGRASGLRRAALE